MNVVELAEREEITSAMAVDYVAVEVEGRSQAQWARDRGTSQARVSENVNTVKRILNSE